MPGRPTRAPRPGPSIAAATAGGWAAACRRIAARELVGRIPPRRGAAKRRGWGTPRLQPREAKVGQGPRLSAPEALRLRDGWLPTLSKIVFFREWAAGWRRPVFRIP